MSGDADTFLSPQLETVSGMSPVGGLWRGVSIRTGKGAPVPGWPLTLTQTLRGQCSVPGLSLKVPFGQQGLRKLAVPLLGCVETSSE